MSSIAPSAAVRSLYDLTLADLEKALAPLPAVHARTLWRALYRSPMGALEMSEEFLPPLRRWLAEHLGTSFHVRKPTVACRTESADGMTRKYLLQLEDGETIETVLMRYTGRNTVCVSSQAGCAMGCVFCATGQGGFSRHLAPGEIVAQVLHAQHVLQGGGESVLRNLVLMGMGEPLHNYDAVMTALEIIADPRGIGLAPSRIAISTVGVVPGILRLAKEGRPYNLAVSLHGATQEERAALVPVARRWPLEELMSACQTFCHSTGRHIFFEWTLIAGKNDSVKSAKALGELLAGIPAHVNLIPLNGTAGFQGAATDAEGARGFQETLRRYGIPSTVRQRRGIDVAAGCGQLRQAEAAAA